VGQINLLGNSQISQIDLCFDSPQKVKSNDAIQIESVIHSSYFYLKSIDKQPTDCQGIDLFGKYELCPANPTDAMDHILRFHTQINCHQSLDLKYRTG